MLTTEQIRNRTKTVTRRLGWDGLKVGEVINAVEKCMGLKKGERVKVLAQLRIKSIVKQPLCWLTPADCEREGFPHLTPEKFIEMFIDAHKRNYCHPFTLVNRIEFEYLDYIQDELVELQDKEAWYD